MRSRKTRSRRHLRVGGMPPGWAHPCPRGFPRNCWSIAGAAGDGDREVAVGEHLAHGQLTDFEELRLTRQLAGVIHPEQEHLLVLAVGDRA